VQRACDTQGRLCTHGNLPALSCTGQGTAQYTCDWSSNWGAMIGMNPTAAHTAWGASATGSVAFTDSFGLMITSAETPVAFASCISGISAR
jgi:hypothetical protein